MKFKINVKQLAKVLVPVIDIATRDIDKDYEGADKIMLRPRLRKLIIEAHGGFSSIFASIPNKAYGEVEYVCQEMGHATVNAKDLLCAIDSFPDDKVILIKCDPDNLVISPQGDENEFQTIPLFVENIPTPKIAKSYEKCARVDRKVLTEGLKKVEFAIGFVESMPEYLVANLEINNNCIRFVAGTGARFAIYDVKSNNITKIDMSTSFLFPKGNIKNIIRVLKKTSSEYVTIKQASATKSTPAQIILEFEGIKLVLVDFDTAITYKDVNRILQRPFPYTFTSKLADWKCAVAGVEATYNQEMKEQNMHHYSHVTANLENGFFAVGSDNELKSNRKVPFVSCSVANPVEEQDGTNPHFCCNTSYLAEMVKMGAKGKNEEIVISVEDYNKPILVRYPEKENKTTGSTSQFSLFFAKHTPSYIERKNQHGHNS